MSWQSWENVMQIIKPKRYKSHSKWHISFETSFSNSNYQFFIIVFIREQAKFIEEMESQRAALKVFYQTQLDELVRSKVDEYQKQFDQMEKSIRRETKQNERIIAERALKQIELLTQKYANKSFTFLNNNDWSSRWIYADVLTTINIWNERQKSIFFFFQF